MKLTQVITRSSIAAVTLLNLSLATSAMAEGQSSTIAEPIVVTRGPNGAAHVVKADNVPVDAKVAPMTEANEFPQVTQKGPGGAAHLVKESKSETQNETQAKTPRLIRRGTHGAFFLSNK